MGFTRIATVDQIPLGSMRAYSAKGKDVLIINYGGSYFAINSKCTHMGGNLAKGRLEGKIITCPRHGAKFDITSGACVSKPKIGLLKPSIKDEVNYIVKLEGDNILVDI